MHSFPFALVSAVGALTILAASTVHAGLIATPLPAGTKYLFSVPGVLNVGGLGTFFSCTSTSKASRTVTVDVFAPNGTLDKTASLAVDSGKSVTFGTRLPQGFVIDVDMATGLINGGAARILSTDTKLICSALVADALSFTPTSLASLNVIAKLKQKAAN